MVFLRQTEQLVLNTEIRKSNNKQKRETFSILDMVHIAASGLPDPLILKICFGIQAIRIDHALMRSRDVHFPVSISYVLI